jgi:hypothetical protein
MAAAFVLRGDLMGAPNVRRFGLTSPEFYEAVCEPRERPWIPNCALPREPRWPRADDGVWVDAETEDAAGEAFGEWRRRVEAEDWLTALRNSQAACAYYGTAVHNECADHHRDEGIPGCGKGCGNG